MGVNFLNKYPNLVISKSRKKIIIKLLKFEVKNFQHLQSNTRVLFEIMMTLNIYLLNCKMHRSCTQEEGHIYSKLAYAPFFVHNSLVPDG